MLTAYSIREACAPQRGKPQVSSREAARHAAARLSSEATLQPQPMLQLLGSRFALPTYSRYTNGYNKWLYFPGRKNADEVSRVGVSGGSDFAGIFNCLQH